METRVNDPRKQSLYIPSEMLEQMRGYQKKWGHSMSKYAQWAWEMAMAYPEKADNPFVRILDQEKQNEI